jgi:MFS family permease
MLNRSSRLHYAWIVLGVSALIMLVAAGLRAVFGVFITPIEAEFRWDRASLSGVAAISILLSGALSPFVGWLADRWGPRRVIFVSCLLLGIGCVFAAHVRALWQLYASAGVLLGLGAAGVGFPPAAALAARWFEARRGLVLGVLGASSSAGQLILIPLAVWITVQFGWRASYLALGIGLLAISLPLLLFVMKDSPQAMGLVPFGAKTAGRTVGAALGQTSRVGVTEAARVPAFWLLCSTFFVCGYTSVGLIQTHLAPHAEHHGFTPMQAATALGIVGAMNIVGTLISGWCCDRFGAKPPLFFSYALRGASLIFLLFVETTSAFYVFAVIFGLNWISTVPATTSLTARIFGAASVGTLSGWITFAHQVGAALGAAAGGWIFEATGSYTWAFVSAAALAFVATGLTLAIRDEPLARTPTARPAPIGVPASAT